MTRLSIRVEQLTKAAPIKPKYDFSTMSDEDLRFLASLPISGNEIDCSKMTPSEIERAEVLKTVLDSLL